MAAESKIIEDEIPSKPYGTERSTWLNEELTQGGPASEKGFLVQSDLDSVTYVHLYQIPSGLGKTNWIFIDIIINRLP